MQVDRRPLNLSRQGVRFLVVGGASYFVDVVVFNLLAHGPGGGLMADRPVTAKVVSTIVSALVSFYGNKLWTFDEHLHPRPWRQTVDFVAVNVVAWAIMLAPLVMSRHLLGLDDVVSDNIAGNIVGLGFALAFRFWAYRRWVFPEGAPAGL